MMDALLSAGDLARYHAARSTVYRAIAYLVGSPANERTKTVARGILADSQVRSLARDERELALASTMETVESESTPCTHQDDRVRREAFAAVGRSDGDSPGAEAEVISALAERTARAIRQNDLFAASSLTDLQSRFMDEHAEGCLLELAT